MSVYKKLVEKSQLVLDSIISETEQDVNVIKEKINQIDDYFSNAIAPKKYYGTDGIEAQSIVGFEKCCMAIRSHNLIELPRKASALAFLQALELIKEKNKPEKK